MKDTYEYWRQIFTMGTWLLWMGCTRRKRHVFVLVRLQFVDWFRTYGAHSSAPFEDTTSIFGFSTSPLESRPLVMSLYFFALRCNCVTLPPIRTYPKQMFHSISLPFPLQFSADMSFVVVVFDHYMHNAHCTRSTNTHIHMHLFAVIKSVRAKYSTWERCSQQHCSQNYSRNWDSSCVWELTCRMWHAFLFGSPSEICEWCVGVCASSFGWIMSCWTITLAQTYTFCVCRCGAAVLSSDGFIQQAKRMFQREKK